jgi:hypothetical protein
MTSSTTTGRLGVRRATLQAIVVGVLVLSAAAAPATALGKGPTEVAVPLSARVLNVPNPVLGADNRMHLAYELELSDLYPFSVTLRGVQAEADGRPIGASVTGARLLTELRIDSGATGTTIPAGGGAVVFMDVTYPRGRRPPRRLTHRFSISYQIPGSATKRVSFVGVPTTVGRRRAIRIAPPLRGPGWVDFNGCCATITSHRGAIEPIDGTTHVPERFAIDFAQLNAQGHLFSGPLGQLSSYPYFGDPVYSVANGTVARTHDGQPEQVPGQNPAPGTVTVQNAGGNYIVIKIAPGEYAFYAHLQPGSLRVHPGQHVSTGQMIAQLGDTGNASAPHLHFHVMSSPSPLRSNGLPYTFTSFGTAGVLTNPDAVFTGKRGIINTRELAGAHHDQLPLNNEVLNFP